MRYKVLFILIISFLLLPIIATSADVIKENVDLIEANVSKRIQIISEDVHITEIEFVFSKDIEETQFTISKLNNKPSRAPSLNYSVYEFFEIKTGTISDASYLTSANITLYVAKSWLESLSIYESKIFLLRFEDKDWEVLETEVIEETTSTYTFKANSPGFDYFAITGIRNTEDEVEEEVVEDEEVEQEETDELIEEATNLVEKEPIDPTILILGGVIAGLVIAVLLLVFRMKNIKKRHR